MKDYRLAVGRVFLLATLLALLPAPVTSQGDSTTVRVITETTWHSLFARNLCIQEPDPVRLAEHIP